VKRVQLTLWDDYDKKGRGKEKRGRPLAVDTAEELQELVEHLHEPREFLPHVRTTNYPLVRFKSVTVDVHGSVRRRSYRLRNDAGLDYSGLAAVLTPQITPCCLGSLKEFLAACT
jgi:hypothetical protein